MPKASATQQALDRENEIDTSDIPEQTDFSRAVRGRAGLELVMELTRLRQALRKIRDWPGGERDPVSALYAVREEARRALTVRPVGTIRSKSPH